MAEPTVEEVFSWAWNRKAHAGFFCYQFKDGSQWLLYETHSHGHLLRPWPQASEGWDEALPPSLGNADEELQAYRVSSYLDFLMASRSYVAAMQNTSTPAEVAACFNSFQRAVP